ncbi:MAG: hypothetical protein KDE63_06690, partial [Novosphingobium sp.]|nr:hypothetical protein [Novosphingobium sp.]
VVKIMHRKPGGVTGDGQHTISQLVSLARQEAEKDTRRAWKNRVSLVLDEEAHSILAEDGHNPDSVPAEGVFVPLRRKSNISVGGTYDVLDPATFHPENLQLAVRVARTIGLDIAGVDLIIPDPAKPWQAQDAIICEVNAQPQIGYRDTPHIFEDILRELIPGNGRIPVHLIVLAPGEEAPDSLHMLARKLRCNAFSDGKRTMVQGQDQSRLFTDSFAAAQALLIDRAVTGALLVMPITDVLTLGLPARYIDTVRIALPAISDDRVRSMVKHAEMLIQPHTRSLQHISCTDVAS